MKNNTSKGVVVSFVVISCALMNRAAHALEPQVLFNFRVSPGTVAGTLVQGPDGNFYRTTARGRPAGSGTVFGSWASEAHSLPLESWILLTNGVFCREWIVFIHGHGNRCDTARFYRVSSP
jgi:hypothetical protein